MRKKLITAIIALSLVLSCMVGVTVAWLYVETPSVTNTFSPSDITLKLDETTTKYQMVPGVDIAKDPKVTVKADFEAYVFVKIVENGTVKVDDVTYDFDSFIEYTTAEGWTLHTTTTDENGNDTVVIYREITAGEYNFEVLANNKVTTKIGVTKQMMNAYKDDSLKLIFTAYAVQKAGMTSIADAWNAAQGLKTTT